MAARGSTRVNTRCTATIDVAGSLLFLLMIAASSSQESSVLVSQGCLEFREHSPHECTRCASGYFLQQADPHVAGSSSLCLGCIAGCLECDNPDLCIKCDAAFTQRPAESTCEPCDASCETCGEEPSTCLSCHTLWLFDPEEHRCSLTFTILGAAIFAALFLCALCFIIVRRLRKKQSTLDELETPRLRPGRSKKQSPNRQLLSERILDEELQRADGRPMICSMDLIGMVNKNIAISEVDQRTDGAQSHVEEYKGLFRSVK